MGDCGGKSGGDGGDGGDGGGKDGPGTNMRSTVLATAGVLTTTNPPGTDEKNRVAQDAFTRREASLASKASAAEAFATGISTLSCTDAEVTLTVTSRGDTPGASSAKSVAIDDCTGGVKSSTSAAIIIETCTTCCSRKKLPGVRGGGIAGGEG